MPNFSKATISPEAAGMSETLAMMALMTELQQKQYQVEAAGVQTEGQASLALGQATQSSLQDEAKNTKDSAWGSIASGISTVGAETLSIGVGAYGMKRANNSADNEMKNVQDWEEELNKPAGGQANREVAELNANDKDEAEEIKQKLRKGQKNLQKFGDQSASQELKDALNDAKQKGMQAQLDKFQESLDKKYESIQNQRSKTEQSVDRWQNRASSIAQGTGNMASGFMSVKAAKAKDDQADQELLKSQSNYVYDTMKQAIQTTESSVQATESNKRSLIETLMAGLAASNRV